MEGREHCHEVYREGAVSYMIDNSDDFAPFIECNFRDYCHKMQQDGSWGGNLELQALSMAFEVNITIHQFDAPCLEIFNQFDKAVHLSYHDEEHYCSVRNIDDERNSPPTPIKLLQSNSSNGNSDSSDANCNISKKEKIVMDSTGCRNIAIVREALEDNCDDVDATVEYLIGLRAIGEGTSMHTSKLVIALQSSQGLYCRCRY
jgi:OTU domain-containing protein 3